MHDVSHILFDIWVSILSHDNDTRTAAEEIVYRNSIIKFWSDVNASLTDIQKSRLLLDIDLIVSTDE